tara:strand:+ start:1481 stop:1900 length:420 start_codon:yes stop_codon:yes gene_type:complete
MKEIYSKVEKNKLLHIIYLRSDINGRQNIIPDNNFLQLASLKLEKGKSFTPHKHKWNNIDYTSAIAQESWVVISGAVKVDYYDLDNTLIENHIIKAGDCTITLEGGHNYTIIENGTLIYEYKTGPYKGINLDKEPLFEN